MLKAILGAARDVYTYRYFNDPRKAPRYRGVYPTYRSAEKALPRGKVQGFNAEAVPDYFLKTAFALNPGDYPVLFWLSQILEAGSGVFDLGGGLGQCYYTYRDFLAFPPGIHWVVCDVESLIERGRALAEERRATDLSFTNDPSQANGAQILLSNGALHYIEPDLSEMLGPLAALPHHILINRVPMYSGEPYYTQQNTHHSYSVNKVMNESQFVRRLEELKYERVDAWTLPRTLHVPFHPERFVKNFRGFYFRLTGR
ncbi:MAG TPA: methyltransferase, TIGR04325 family [Acidobacteriaceae bacterium]|jgi:putative methyltransferase (TIGR04325 family)